MALKSTTSVEGTTLTFTCTDDETKDNFSRGVNLASLFGIGPDAPALLLTALVFAAKTALRNATGGRDLSDAESSVDSRLAAWANGEWGAERGGDGSGAAFTQGHILAKAVARVYASRFSDAAAAAAALSEMLDTSLKGAGHAAFADLAEEAQREARNAFVKHARAKDGAVDAAVAAIQAEQATARAAKKAGGTAAGGSLF